MNPPTTVLLPDFRELPHVRREAECATVKNYWLPTDRMTEVDWAGAVKLTLVAVMLMV